MARQLQSGRWTSKLGKLEDVARVDLFGPALRLQFSAFLWPLRGVSAFHPLHLDSHPDRPNRRVPIGVQ